MQIWVALKAQILPSDISVSTSVLIYSVLLFLLSIMNVSEYRPNLRPNCCNSSLNWSTQSHPKNHHISWRRLLLVLQNLLYYHPSRHSGLTKISLPQGWPHITKIFKAPSQCFVGPQFCFCGEATDLRHPLQNPNLTMRCPHPFSSPLSLSPLLYISCQSGWHQAPSFLHFATSSITQPDPTQTLWPVLCRRCSSFQTPPWHQCLAQSPWFIPWSLNLIPNPLHWGASFAKVMTPKCPTLFLLVTTTLAFSANSLSFKSTPWAFHLGWSFSPPPSN